MIGRRADTKAERRGNKNETEGHVRFPAMDELSTAKDTVEPFPDELFNKDVVEAELGTRRRC